MSNPTSPTPPKIIDDKSPHCIPFITSRLHSYFETAIDPTRPFVIGLNGVQGAGKTTLVSALQNTLKEKEGLETLVLRENEDNLLVQYRGEPGTLPSFEVILKIILIKRDRNP
jgi:D-glycerate 3-kinase